MSSGLFKDLCGRGTNAARPNPTGTDRQYYDGYLYEQTDTVGAEPAGFYRYDGVGFLWRLIATAAPSGSAGGDLSGTYPNPTVAQSSTAFALTSDISPAQLTADTNDWNPTGLATASTIRASTDASRNLTGLQGGGDGRLIILHNIGAQNLVLKDESASSSAANRFALNADVTLGAKQAALLQYDSTSSRWRLIAGPAVVGGGGGGDASTASTTFAFSGDISPSQITANQNDYNPAGLSTATVLRLNSDASRNITGLVGGADGRVVIIYNVGSNNIVLVDESSGSTAGNRFALLADRTIIPEKTVVLIYDATASRWRLVNDSILQQTAADTLKILSSTAKLYFDTDTRFEWNGTVLKATNGTNSVVLEVRTLQLNAGGNSSYYINSGDGILVGASVKLGFARNSTLSTPGAWLQNDSAQRGVIGVYGNFGSGDVGGTFKFKPERPAQITTNKNDYQTATVSKYVFVNSDASRDITGFKDTQSPSSDFAQDGEERVLLNNGSNNIVLKHEDANSTAQFRFRNSTGADITLSADQAADLIYDSTISRWRVFKRN